MGKWTTKTDTEETIDLTGKIAEDYKTVRGKCMINILERWEKWKEWDIKIFHWFWQIQKNNPCCLKDQVTSNTLSQSSEFKYSG